MESGLLVRKLYLAPKHLSHLPLPYSLLLPLDGDLIETNKRSLQIQRRRRGNWKFHCLFPQSLILMEKSSTLAAAVHLGLEPIQGNGFFWILIQIRIFFLWNDKGIDIFEEWIVQLFSLAFALQSMIPSTSQYFGTWGSSGGQLQMGNKTKAGGLCSGLCMLPNIDSWQENHQRGTHLLAQLDACRASSYSP